MTMSAPTPDLFEETWSSSDPARTARLFCLRNQHVEVWLTDSGASIYRLRTPDASGHWEDIACAPRRLEAFWNHPAFMGATVGRYANRIGGACFTLDEETYRLTANEGQNTLHGGESWHRDRWQAHTTQTANAVTVEFSRRSPDGEAGFPGTVDAKVLYRLGTDGQLHIAFSATTDRPTVVNMTNHTYYNLNGAHYQNLAGHDIQLPADFITAVGSDSIPTGDLQAVAGTAFDLTQPTDLMDRLTPLPDALRGTQGFDHNYAYKPANSPNAILLANVVNRRNGRILKVYSTQPGMQFYTGNFMAGLEGPDPERQYEALQAFCLEPQHFPDTPNQPTFPACTVTPDQPYAEAMVLAFGVTPPAG